VRTLHGVQIKGANLSGVELCGATRFTGIVAEKHVYKTYNDTQQWPTVNNYIHK